MGQTSPLKTGTGSCVCVWCGGGWVASSVYEVCTAPVTAGSSPVCWQKRRGGLSAELETRVACGFFQAIRRISGGVCRCLSLWRVRYPTSNCVQQCQGGGGPGGGTRLLIKLLGRLATCPAPAVAQQLPWLCGVMQPPNLVEEVMQAALCWVHGPEGSVEHPRSMPASMSHARSGMLPIRGRQAGWLVGLLNRDLA
jgi:hypothetical protein